MGGVLVLTGQTTVARYICVQYSDELAWQTAFHTERPLLNLRPTANTTPGRGIGGEQSTGIEIVAGGRDRGFAKGVRLLLAVSTNQMPGNEWPLLFVVDVRRPGRD